MKTKILLLIVMIFQQLLFSQESIVIQQNKTRIVGITPLSDKVEKVNGFAIGIGMEDVIAPNANKKTINGLNIDVNPLGFLIICFYDISKINNTQDAVQHNGLNISAAGFLRNNSHNGVSISMYNYGNKMNGVSISAIANLVEELNGIYIAGLGNEAERGNGFVLGAFNNVKEFNGVQIGITNKSNKMKGVQIGLVNKNKNGRSFQIGFWNKNSKRTLPIINF